MAEDTTERPVPEASSTAHSPTSNRSETQYLGAAMAEVACTLQREHTSETAWAHHNTDTATVAA